MLSPVNSRRVDQPETGCFSMRSRWTLIALGGALLLAVTGTSTAQADTTGGTSTGNGGNSAGPATAGSIQSTSGQTPTVSYVPAFATDLPKGSSSLGPTSSAASAAVAPAVSWICTVYASDPSRAWHTGGDSVQGEGWQSCTGATYWQTALTVTIQRYLGLGVWQNKYQWSSGYTSNPWLERIIWYYCSGTGTETYRIVTDGWQGTYHKAVQSLNYLTTTC